MNRYRIEKKIARIQNQVRVMVWSGSLTTNDFGSAFETMQGYRARRFKSRVVDTFTGKVVA